MYLIRLHSYDGFYYYLTNKHGNLWSDKEDLGSAHVFHSPKEATTFFTLLVKDGHFDSPILGKVSVVTVTEVKEIDFKELETAGIYKREERNHKIDSILEDLLEV
jgi:hypothetical protein